MYPHRINLRGPWDAQPLARTRLRRDGSIEEVDGAVSPALKMMMPCRWEQAGLGPFQGRVRFRRSFGWPKELAGYERLWLVVGAADYFAKVILNDQPLGEHAGAFDPFEFEITALVKERNELVIDVDCPVADPLAQREWLWRGRLGTGGGLWGTVALEVRRESFLKLARVAATFDGHLGGLEISGEICAQQDQANDLSVRLGNRELTYRASRRGSFALVLPTGPVEPWQPMGLGEQRCYELQIRLNDVACQLDQKFYQVGFRHVEKRNDGWRINGTMVTTGSPTDYWLEPVAEMYTLDIADARGGMSCLEMPIRPEVISVSHRRSQAEQLKNRLLDGVAHHPSLIAVTEPNPAFIGVD